MSSFAPRGGGEPSPREIAEGLAHDAGMTLDEWVNQVGLEQDPASRQAPPVRFVPPGRLPAAPVLRRYEQPRHPDDEILGVTQALARLASRLEASEQHTTLALAGVEQSLARLATQLEAGEREQTAIAARFEGAVDDLRVEQSRVTQRLERIEEEAAAALAVEPPPTVDPEALVTVDRHLDELEARTAVALKGVRDEFDGVHTALGEAAARAASRPDAEVVDALKTGFNRLTQRVEVADTLNAQVLKGFQDKLTGLNQKLQASETEGRAEVEQKIRESLDGRFEPIERVLEASNQRIQVAEQRSVDAIARAGKETGRTTEALGVRIEGVERRSAKAIEQLGGEMARMADMVETRLGRADVASSVALEKLNAEMARVTEDMAERIAGAERRSAEVFDDVAARVADVGRQLDELQEASASAQAERIRLEETPAVEPAEDDVATADASEDADRSDDAELTVELFGEPFMPVSDPFVAHIVSAKSSWMNRDPSTREPSGSASGETAPDLYGVDDEYGYPEFSPAVKTLIEQARADGELDEPADEPTDSTFSWLLRFGRKSQKNA